MSSQCSCFHLRRLARRMTVIYDHHLLADGLTITQYSLLSRLGKYGPLANIALASDMGMERSTLSRSLKPLMQEGWVMTVDMPAGTLIDKRSFGLNLTPAGRAKWQSALPNWQRAQDEIDAIVGADTQATLMKNVDDAYQKLNAGQ